MRGSLNFLLFFTLVVISSCLNKGGESNLKYSKLEIYCGCITTISTNIGEIVVNTCLTPSRIPPSKITVPEQLYFSSADTGIVNAVSRLFFQSAHKTDSLSSPSDARFVVLLRQNDNEADTIVFHFSAMFALNEKEMLTYDTNIIDSLRVIIEKESISCD